MKDSGSLRECLYYLFLKEQRVTTLLRKFGWLHILNEALIIFPSDGASFLCVARLKQDLFHKQPFVTDSDTLFVQRKGENLNQRFQKLLPWLAVQKVYAVMLHSRIVTLCGEHCKGLSLDVCELN